MRRTNGMTWLAALALGGGLFLSSGDAAAQGFRWPWERAEKEEQKQPDKQPGERATDRLEEERRQGEQAAAGDREQFIQRLYGMANEQIRLSERAADRAENEQVRAFAREVVREHREWKNVLEQRAEALGFELREERQPVAGVDLPEGRSAEFDIAYLDALMNNVEEIRSDFAEFKEQTGDDEFHAQLSEMFNEDLVEQRERAKDLHDRIRNRARDRGIIE